MSVDRRFAWAVQIKTVASSVAEEATRGFWRAHPDWVTRYGDRAGVQEPEDAHPTHDAATGADR